jgi:Domain of unknown function (DUF3846)
MTTLITLSGKVEAITPRNGATFSADEIHELVGGYLECIRLRDERIIWFDEEGKLEGKPPNMVATFIALDGLQRGDVIVDNAVITTLTEVGE